MRPFEGANVLCISCLGGGRNGAKFAAGFRRWRNSWTASAAVRFAVAAILITAAVLKTHQLATEPVLGTGLLESRWFLIVVVQFELLLGFWLTSGLAIRWAWWIAVATFSLFAVGAGAKGVAGEPSCGCFGRVPTNPWFAFWIDVCAVVALWCFRPWLHRSHAEPSASPAAPPGIYSSRSLSLGQGSKRPACLVGAWLMGAIGLTLGAILGANPNVLGAIGDRVGDTIILRPERMLGKRFQLGEYIDIGDQLARERWLVVLYRVDCPDCESLMAAWPNLASEAVEGRRTAFVSVGPDLTTHHSLATNISWGTLRSDLHWFATVPVVFTLDENRVVDARVAVDLKGAGLQHASETVDNSPG